jgi:hypothetical protein
MTVRKFRSPLNHRMDLGITPHTIMTPVEMHQIDNILWDYDLRRWMITSRFNSY